MKLSKLLGKINMVSEKIEEIILSLGIIVLAIILIVNVILRKAGGSIYFIDELAMFLVILITFVGLSYATRKATNIRMDAIFDLAPLRVQKIMIFVLSIISAAVMFYMTYLSVNYVHYAYRWKMISSAINMPYWIGIIIVPVGLFLSGIHFVRTIVKNIQEKEDVWLSSEQKNEYE